MRHREEKFTSWQLLAAFFYFIIYAGGPFYLLMFRQYELRPDGGWIDIILGFGHIIFFMMMLVFLALYFPKHWMGIMKLFLGVFISVIITRFVQDGEVDFVKAMIVQAQTLYIGVMVSILLFLKPMIGALSYSLNGKKKQRIFTKDTIFFSFILVFSPFLTAIVLFRDAYMLQTQVSDFGDAMVLGLLSLAIGQIAYLHYSVVRKEFKVVTREEK